jgi:L-threonylcarbamoyladenylate synthase
VLLLVAAPEMALKVARKVPETGARLMARFWPGPLTIIFPSHPHLPRLITSGTGSVGVRQPRHPLTCRLITALGYPITGTSANRSGRPPLTQAAEVAREFGDEVDLILDAGECQGGKPSTIIDASHFLPRLVRAGAIPATELAEIVPEMARIPIMRGSR